MKEETNIDCNQNSDLYSRSTLEFVTVALEYCSFMEQFSTAGESIESFTDKATKLLPLLYLKATLLPKQKDEENSYDVFEETGCIGNGFDPALSVTEQMYEAVRINIAALLGEQDSFLETFHPDMPYSDTPIACFISETLADVYQDLGNFVTLFRTENENMMHEGMNVCMDSFQHYWGRSILNALKALHAIR